MIVYRCPHCRCEVAKGAPACGDCGRSFAPLSWARRLRGLPAWAPDAVVEDYAHAAFPIRIGLFAFFWLLFVAAGGWSLMRADAALADLPEEKARVAAALEEQGVPENVRRGTELLLDSNGAGFKALRAAGWLFLAAGVLGLVGEANSLWMVRRLLGARSAGEPGEAGR